METKENGRVLFRYQCLYGLAGAVLSAGYLYLAGQKNRGADRFRPMLCR